MSRPRLAIAGLTACSGCQLSLLNCEAELPLLLERIEFQFFPLACSPVRIEGCYDAALVEGCCSTAHEAELLRELRDRSRLLIALGTCAAWGGVATLRNDTRGRSCAARSMAGTRCPTTMFRGRCPPLLRWMPS